MGTRSSGLAEENVTTATVSEESDPVANLPNHHPGPRTASTPLPMMYFLPCFSSASTDFPLNFIDYLWVPTNDVDKTIDEKNIFCQVGKIHHWYTYLNKTVKKSSGTWMQDRLLEQRTTKGGSHWLKKSHKVWMMMMIAASLMWARASEMPEQSKMI